MLQVFHAGGVIASNLTFSQEAIIRDRATKHRSLLHNQPSARTLWDGPETDTRIEESELILDSLLRRYGVMAPEEGIEEIAAVAADGPSAACLVIQTERQTIFIAYN